MTPRQTAIMAYLRRRQSGNLPPPTYREIGDACDISSTSVVKANVDALARRRLVIRQPGARGVMLPGESREDLEVEVSRLRRALEVRAAQVKALRRQVEMLRQGRPG